MSARSNAAKLRAIARHEAEGAAVPASETAREPERKHSPPGLPAMARGGRRKVLYLHDDVWEVLEQLQREAEDEGLRLTQSAIVEYAVRNLEVK